MSSNYSDALSKACTEGMIEQNKALAQADLSPAPFRWRLWNPLGKWIFVKADPRIKETAGGIILPDQLLGVERVMEGSGHIVKIGNPKDILQSAGVPLEVGMRICYRGFLKDVFQFDREKEDDNCIVFMLRAEDVMAIIGEEVTLGAFS